MEIKNILIATLVCTASLAQAVKITNRSTEKIFVKAFNQEYIAIAPDQTIPIVLPVAGLIRREKNSSSKETPTLYVYPKFPAASQIEIRENEARGKWAGKWGKWKKVFATLKDGKIIL